MRRIRRLVGEVTAEQLRYVDWALARDVGVFIPVAGPCGYAITAGHAHPAWSFVLPFDDRCRVRVDGRVLTSRTGELCAIAPGVPHEELLGDEPARYAAVFVAPRHLRRALAHHRVDRLPPVRVARFRGTPEIVGAVREMMLEHSARLPGSGPMVAAAATRLVHLLLRALLGTALPERVPEREAIRRAVELAETRVGDPLTVPDLATSFARAYRMAPSRYRKMLRRGRHRPQGR